MFRKRLEDNIWKYAIQLITNKRIFAAVLSVYYLTIPNVAVQDVGIIIGIGVFFSFLFELPSGYVADKIGHKEALILSNIFMLTSSTFFYFSSNFYTLIAASIFLSIGTAFSSGTGTAFMHETITALGREKEYVHIMGKVRSIGFAVPAVLTAIVPFLIVYGYKLPFLVAMIIDLIGLIAVISLVTPHVKKERVEELEVGPNNFMRAFREVKHYNLLNGMLFSALVSSFVFSFGQYRGPYQASIGVAVIWFGVFHSTGRMLASLMLWFSGKLHTKITQKSVRLIKIIIFGGLFLIISFVPNRVVVIIAFLLMNASLFGLAGLSGAGAHRKLKNSSLKATILSIRAQIQNLLTAASVPVLGFLIMNLGYRKGFLIFGVAFIVSTLLMHRRMNQDVDSIDDDSGGD